MNAGGFGFYVLGLEDIEILRDAHAPCVHAQRERALPVTGVEHVFPFVGLAALDRVDPPRGIVQARDGVALNLGQQRFAFAQECAQHGVDETLRKREFAPRGDGVDGLIDDGERRVSGVGFVVDEQRERAGQHIRYMRRRRLAHQFRDQRVGHGKTPHRAVRDVLRRPARHRHVRCRDRTVCKRGGQRRTGAHRADRLRGGIERERERIGREMKRGQTGVGRRSAAIRR